MSILKDNLSLYENAKQAMLRKGIICNCDCGEFFYKHPSWNEGMIYEAMEREFANFYSDKSVYRDQIKQLLQESTMNDVCPYCNKKLI